MLMVIFGAGASYDSISSLDPVKNPLPGIRPPLAKDLFANVPEFRGFIDKYTQCRPIIAHLEPDASGRSVEEVLGELDFESKNDPTRKKQILALRYYIRSVINSCEEAWFAQAGGVSNYETLFEDIRLRGSALFVTFNYDTLLERALGKPFQRRTDYIDRTGFSVLKLHGSSDWLQIVQGVYFHRNRPAPDDRDIIESASSLTFGTIIPKKEVPILRANPDVDLDKDALFVPALAIPIARKSDFACPKEHLDYLKQRLPDVTKIVIIGWRASEAHVIELLKRGLRSDVEIKAVCGDIKEAESSLQNLRDAGIQGNFEALAGGFTEYVRSRKIKQFLDT